MPMEATHESIFGSCVPPDTSLTMSAPSSMAALATLEFRVSIEIGMSDSVPLFIHVGFVHQVFRVLRFFVYSIEKLSGKRMSIR